MSQATATASVDRQDADYADLIGDLTPRFFETAGNGPVFTTDATNLYAAYLDALPPEWRQHHTCHACRHFVERFGGLVTIDAQGHTRSALWNYPGTGFGMYGPAIAAMTRLVRKAKVTGVFLTKERIWGQPITGEWQHLSVFPPATMVYREGLLTAFQATAAKAEDYKTVSRALSEFSQPVLDQVVVLLRSDAMYRSEKVLGQAEWLQALQTARMATLGREARNNLVWRAIATAPAAFCHPRSSMIGTLLDDIAAGMDFAQVSKRFADKMHPLQYQRPTAAPAAGAIAAAEKLVEQLGIAASLPRRFARLDEVQAEWRPPQLEAPPKAGGVFGHLSPKTEGLKPLTLPAQTMTWEKFKATVLPSAERIAVHVANSAQNFCALVTAVDPDAPPILQWDQPEQRNPVSWYVYHRGSTPAQFSLTGNTYHDVTAIAYQPSMWNDNRYVHQGQALMLLLAGAKDTRKSGGALFPEILKAELHGVRSVIEAYSNKAEIAGIEDASAAGLMLGKSQSWNVRVRVWSAGRTTDFTLDRWD